MNTNCGPILVKVSKNPQSNNLQYEDYTKLTPAYFLTLPEKTNFPTRISVLNFFARNVAGNQRQ